MVVFYKDNFDTDLMVLIAVTIHSSVLVYGKTLRGFCWIRSVNDSSLAFLL